MASKLIRLFVNQELSENILVTLSKEQSHYLNKVMRKKTDDKIILFNETEWQGTLLNNSSNITVKIDHLLRDKSEKNIIRLIFAPIKLHRLSYLIEKATEIGVTEFIPIITKHSIVDKINLDKALKIAIEASEQCERLDIPKFRSISNLFDLLNSWPKNSSIFLCNEKEKIKKITINENKEYNILVGPEGGFSSEELDFLTNLPFIKSIKLSQNILRTETAVLTALATVEFLLT